MDHREASEDRDPGEVTIETYGAIADAYARRNRTRGEPVRAFIDEFAARLAPRARVLEVGSGPGFTPISWSGAA